ncbi:MAG TPA: hypothetical protein VGL62_07555 [Vicinamibacterales bacterium]
MLDEKQANLAAIGSRDRADERDGFGIVRAQEHGEFLDEESRGLVGLGPRIAPRSIDPQRQRGCGNAQLPREEIDLLLLGDEPLSVAQLDREIEEQELSISGGLAWRRFRLFGWPMRR